MVTMRRDVAVTKNVSVSAEVFNAYDRFMMKKNERRSENVASEFMHETPKKASFDFKREYKTNAEKPVSEKSVVMETESAYDRYLNDCLKNKKKEDVVLSSEEFYESLLTSSEAKKTGRGARILSEKPSEKKVFAKDSAKPSRFKKFGKMILSLYVLFIVGIAFTLVAVNVFDSKSVVADAEENTSVGERTIRPMTTETLENEEGNWFDDLCDAVKK